MANQIKIDVSQMGDVKIENKDGVVIITPVGVPIKSDSKYPEKGYWVRDNSKIECNAMSVYGWGVESSRNVYPRESHAILFGQVLAPLLLKHWVLTGGYWNVDSKWTVEYSSFNKEWGVFSRNTPLLPLAFPFHRRKLAEQFLEENRSQLNEISRLWQEG